MYSNAVVDLVHTFGKLLNCVCVSALAEASHCAVICTLNHLCITGTNLRLRILRKARVLHPNYIGQLHMSVEDKDKVYTWLLLSDRTLNR